MSAWKDLERRVSRALGAERAGPRGRHGADDDGSAPFSVECKRTTRYSLRRAWIEQARRQAKADGRPWLLVVSEHHDSRPLAVIDFWTLVELAQRAGIIEEIEVTVERPTAQKEDPDCGSPYRCPSCRRGGVPDSVWRAISPKVNGGGLLCMECAEFRARRLGIFLLWQAVRITDEYEPAVQG